MIEAYSVDDLKILFYQGRNKFNQLTYKTVKIKGYVDESTKLVRNIKGEETVSTARAYVMHKRLLTHMDYIIFNGARRSVISALRAKDFSPNHQEVALA